MEQIGTYKVLFQVGVAEAGQLELTLNGAPLSGGTQPVSARLEITQIQ